MKSNLVIATLMFLGLIGHANAQLPPTAPHPTPTVSVKVGYPLQNQWWVQKLDVPHRTADRSFLAHVGISLAATVADFEYTQHNLALGGRELNPIFGSHPSRLRMYGIALPVQGAADLLAWHWKRQDDALAVGYKYKRPFFQRWWWVVDAQTAAHVAGLSWGLTH